MMNLDFDSISIAVMLIMIGIWIGVVFEQTMCRDMLLMCAEGETAEKIGDAFYYIVPEKKYVEISRYRSLLFSIEQTDLLALSNELQIMIAGCQPGHIVPRSAVMRKLLTNAHAVVSAHAKCKT